MYKLFLLIIYLFIIKYSFTQPNVNKLFKAITGRFNNEKQISGLPQNISSTITQNKPWVNKLFANHLPIQNSALGNHVLFLEWREDSINGKISRQRIWCFSVNDTQELMMNFYAFKSDSLWAKASSNQKLLSSITLKDLIEYPAGCHLSITKNKKTFTATLDSLQCKIITQKTQRVMHLFAQISITNKGFSYKEKGVLQNGLVVFDVPKHEKYVFTKMK